MKLYYLSIVVIVLVIAIAGFIAIENINSNQRILGQPTKEIVCQEPCVVCETGCCNTDGTICKEK